MKGCLHDDCPAAPTAGSRAPDSDRLPCLFVGVDTSPEASSPVSVQLRPKGFRGLVHGRRSLHLRLRVLLLFGFKLLPCEPCSLLQVAAEIFIIPKNVFGSKNIKCSSKQKSRRSASLQRCYVLRLISWGMETAVLLPVVGRGRSSLAAATAASGRLHCFVPRVMAASLPHGIIKNKLLTKLFCLHSPRLLAKKDGGRVACSAARLLAAPLPAWMRPNPPTGRSEPTRSKVTAHCFSMAL